ncbi:hypothetical protein J4403_00490 [Candidatus Woesearchaeota archaeon]|nr:hypothetical protein [Candidatus Woesearchaeota archaeon]
MKFKKGVDTNASAVASLIAVIALFMIVVILLMPSQERHDLLGDNPSISGTNNSKVILSEYTGNVNPTEKEATIKHILQPVHLFTEDESEVISLSDGTEVKKSLFNSIEREFNLKVDEPQNIKDLSLYVLASEVSGNLIIKLNDEIIFDEKLEKNQPKIIQLPNSKIKNNNLIRVSVGSPGLLVGTNLYNIEYIKARKSYSIVNNNAERQLSITASELSGTSKALLSYECISEEIGSKLRIYLNNNIIFNSYLDCSTETPIELDKSYLIQGPNKLIFETTSGNYLINDIKLETISEKKGYPEYYFKIDDSDYKEIRFGNLDVILSFFLYGDSKKLNVYINENKIEISTDESNYLTSISKYIQKGDNSLKIEPLTSFEIISLKVEIAK